MPEILLSHPDFDALSAYLFMFPPNSPLFIAFRVIIKSLNNQTAKQIVLAYAYWSQGIRTEGCNPYWMQFRDWSIGVSVWRGCIQKGGGLLKSKRREKTKGAVTLDDIPA